MSQPSKQTGRVLVLGEDTRAFLTVARSLGRAGLEIHVAWCPPTAPSLRSRYISKIHWLREYRPGDPACLREFVELLGRESFDLVIPCHDSAVLPLRHWRPRIESLARISLPDDRAFEVAFDKRRTYELAEELRICLPRQQIVRSAADLRLAAGEFGFPLVLKPHASVELENVAARNKVVTVRDHSGLPAAEALLGEKGSLLVQEHFCGIGVGVEVLCRQGEILTAFQHERVHEPLHGGGSSYRKSVALDKDLLGAAQRLMKALDYTGVAMVEFKRNSTSGKWILVEINGRFWGSLPLSVKAGIDFPRYLFEMLCLGRTRFPNDYKLGRYARNWLLDLYWFRENWENDRRDPTLMTVPLPRVALEFRHLLMGRESSDTFTWDDPAPALAEASQFLRSRFLPRIAGWAIVRKRLRRRVQKPAATARRILFVCKGNICRSPFAESVARALFGDQVQVRSAGYYPVSGRPSPEEAVAAASTFGADLSGQRSRVIDAGMASWADLVFVFDFEHLEALKVRCPELLAKAHLLGSLDPEGPLEIMDPFGEGFDCFCSTYGRILRLMHLLRDSVLRQPAGHWESSVETDKTISA